MDTNGVLVEEPELISDDKQDDSNALNVQTNGTVSSFEPLKPEKVRWFYRSDSKRWTKFDGFDSLNIEYRYRANFGNEEEVSCMDGSFNYFVGQKTIVVRGGLYEVNLLEKKCSSIFWPGKFYWVNSLKFILSISYSLLFRRRSRHFSWSMVL